MSALRGLAARKAPRVTLRFQELEAVELGRLFCTYVYELHYGEEAALPFLPWSRAAPSILRSRSGLYSRLGLWCWAGVILPYSSLPSDRLKLCGDRYCILGCGRCLFRGVFPPSLLEPGSFMWRYLQVCRTQPRWKPFDVAPGGFRKPFEVYLRGPEPRLWAT